MGNFPVKAKGYIWAVVILGWLALTLVLLMEEALWKQWQLLVFGCILAVVASNIKVPVVGFRRWPGFKSDNNSSMSLGFVPTYFMLLTLGPAAGMIVGAITALIPTCFPRRSHYYQILFSVSALLLSVFAAGLALLPAGLGRSTGDLNVFAQVADPGRLLVHLAALVGSTYAYYLTNTLLIAAAISLTSGGKSPLAMWQEHFRWTLPGYFAGASCATIANVQIPYVATSWQSFVVVTVVSVPIPLLIFLVYRFHRDKDDASQSYIQDLEKANEELERSQTELRELYTATVESFALAIDAKDAYTKQHINRVKDYAVLLAHEIGLRDDALRAIEYGALLHDIGKLAIPEAILNKSGKLTDDEFEIIKEHPVKGVEILEPVRFPFPVLDVVRSHHERWDGKGYPDALAGEGIPMGGRILAVADVFDALTSDRSYRAGWSHERAVQYLIANKETHFDPGVVDAFLTVLQRLESECDAHASGGGTGKEQDMSANSIPSEMRDAVADGIDRVPVAHGQAAPKGHHRGYRNGCNSGAAAAAVPLNGNGHKANGSANGHNGAGSNGHGSGNGYEAVTAAKEEIEDAACVPTAGGVE